jgi:cytidine deaminase
MTDPNALIQAATQARERAYAPYSRFRVGAALRTTDGAIYTGCNIENGSYGATVCAERVAVFKAVSAGVREFEALAIVCGAEELARPCGICRQVLAEFSPSMQVICANAKGEYDECGLDELLPHRFEPDSLAE